MQISGIFSKIKTPILIGGLCAAMLLTITPVYAYIFTAELNDAAYAQDHLGEQCSDSGLEIILCECGNNQNPLPDLSGIDNECPYRGQELLNPNGCKFAGDLGWNVYAFCARPVMGDGACAVCGCRDVISSWANLVNNRVSRTVTRVSNVGTHHCQVGGTITEYGCAAGHYTTASTTSASMFCIPCPGLTTSSGTTRYGNSSTGNTSITGCSQPANTTFKDNVGQYQFTSSCNYTK